MLKHLLLRGSQHFLIKRLLEAVVGKSVAGFGARASKHERAQVRRILVPQAAKACLQNRLRCNEI